MQRKIDPVGEARQRKAATARRDHVVHAVDVVDESAPNEAATDVRGLAAGVTRATHGQRPRAPSAASGVGSPTHVSGGDAAAVGRDFVRGNAANGLVERMLTVAAPCTMTTSTPIAASSGDGPEASDELTIVGVSVTSAQTSAGKGPASGEPVPGVARRVSVGPGRPA